MRILSLVLFPAACVLMHAQTAPKVFNVRDHGAKGDGHALDTAAIQAAIDAAVSSGGGTVFFPAGNYLSFSVHLKSHLTLYLDSGATVIAAEPPADLSSGYDAPEPNPVTDQYEDFGHSHWHNSLFWGENLEDLTIAGPGRIYGKGLSRGGGRRDLLPAERKLPEAERPKFPLPEAARAAIAAQKTGPYEYPGRDTLPAGVGNKAIALKNCRNVIFRDFTIEHGGHFAILATGVDNWTLDNLKIDTNRDGVDLDCCQNVRMSNCTVNSPYDDGICPKSSYALGYARPTENVTIVNCQVSGYDEGTLLDGTRQRTVKYNGGPTGRIKCGTESNGGFRNITIADCVFEYCRGLALESVDGALMEDIAVSNITMRDIVNAPIFVRLGARLRGPEGTKIGTARRIKIDNVVAHNVAASGGALIVGLSSAPIEDLTLSNILVEYAGGGTAEEAARVVPEHDRDYPEPMRFGTLSAWGMFVRHVKNFSVDRVELRSLTADARPVVYLEDVTRATFDRTILSASAGTAKLAVKNVHGLSIQHCEGLRDLENPAPIDDEKF